MKSVFAAVTMLLPLLLCASLYATEKDAPGCKDHPLIPRMQDYYIAACGKNVADFEADPANGNLAETVHIKGNSSMLMYQPQPELKSKPSEAQVRSDFENAVKKQGGTLFGTTPGQKWPVYKLVKDGKQLWIVLLINPGEYFTGSYAFRIIEQ